MLEQASTAVTVASQLTVVGLLASALAGLVTGWIGAYAKVKGENFATKSDFEDALARTVRNTEAIKRVEALVARRQTLDAELREAIRQFTVAVSSVIHSMCALTWDAKARNRIHTEMVRRYDAELHQLSPQIMGQLALIGALSPAAHQKLDPFVSTVFSLDAQIGEAIVRGEPDPMLAIPALEEHWRASVQLDREFRSLIANLLAEAKAGAA